MQDAVERISTQWLLFDELPFRNAAPDFPRRQNARVVIFTIVDDGGVSYESVITSVQNTRTVFRGFLQGCHIDNKDIAFAVGIGNDDEQVGFFDMKAKSESRLNCVWVHRKAS
ncbi:MAG: hypothetical protein NTX50_15985, partial [Candidatus Sumerlaeota bacterium]|nr:hypothetical protein [Candidatus Sumerlaeota bacterium]